MEKNIFDLTNLTDVPSNITKDLKKLSKNEFSKKIIELFYKAKRPLTVDEVTVAYFRLFNESKDRKTIMIKLSNMCNSKRPAITNAGKRGLYILNQEIYNLK